MCKLYFRLWSTTLVEPQKASSSKEVWNHATSSTQANPGHLQVLSNMRNGGGSKPPPTSTLVWKNLQLLCSQAPYIIQRTYSQADPLGENQHFYKIPGPDGKSCNQETQLYRYTAWASCPKEQKSSEELEDWTNFSNLPETMDKTNQCSNPHVH